MRMGFFMGAALGAAAAYYWSKNKGSLNMNMGELSGKAMSAFMGMMSSNSSNQKQQQESHGQNSHSEAGMNELEKIVQQDPELKKQVDDIISDSDSSYTQ